MPDPQDPKSSAHPKNKPKPKKDGFDKPSFSGGGGSKGGKSKGGGSKKKSGGGRGGTSRSAPREPQGLSPEQQHALRVTLSQVRFPFDTSRYMEEAIRLGQGADFFYARVMQSPEFRAHYPGIFRPDGTIRMTPAEYDSRKEEYASTAARFGFRLTSQDIAGLFQSNKDPKMFAELAAASQRVKTNPNLISELNAMIDDRNANLRKQGQPLIPRLNGFADAVSFVAGRASQEVYDLFESAQFAALAKEAGIKISNQRARELAAGTEGIADYEDVQKAFTQIALDFAESGADLHEFGLTEDDLVTLNFGGAPKPGALSRAQVAIRAAQAVKQARAEAHAEQPSAFVEVESGRPVLVGRREAGL